MPSRADFEILFAILQAAVIILLTALLVQKEMLRAMGREQIKKRMKVLDTATIVLLLLFGIIIVARLTSFKF